MAKAGLQIFSDLREQSDAPWEEAMLKPPTTENALIDRRGILRTGAALAAVGPALLHGEHAKAQPRPASPITIIDAQVHAYAAHSPLRHFDVAVVYLAS